MAISADLLTNVASLSKLLTTIGVLQSLAKNGLTIDSKIFPYLYPDWVEGKNIDTITFRRILRAYEHAVRERYRFYSYGDCMFVEQGAHALMFLPVNRLLTQVAEYLKRGVVTMVRYKH